MASIPRLLADLETAFPTRQGVTESMIKLWTRSLADLPLDAVEASVDEVILTGDRFPSIAAVRAAAAERALGLPSEPQALATIDARIAWGRRDEADRDAEPPAVHPLVREALARAGGYHAFRSADEPGVVRGQFGRYYRELRAAAIRDVQVGERRELSAGLVPRELTA